MKLQEIELSCLSSRRAQHQLFPHNDIQGTIQNHLLSQNLYLCCTYNNSYYDGATSSLWNFEYWIPEFPMRNHLEMVFVYIMENTGHGII